MFDRKGEFDKKFLVDIASSDPKAPYRVMGGKNLSKDCHVALVDILTDTVDSLTLPSLLDLFDLIIQCQHFGICERRASRDAPTSSFDNKFHQGWVGTNLWYVRSGSLSHKCQSKQNGEP